jgi:hypothetical protein
MAALPHLVHRVIRLPALATVLAGHLLMAPPAFAQWLRDEPLRLFDQRLTIAADVSATAGARDDEAFFNYTDYERNALRTLRIAITAAWQPLPRLAALTEVRSDDLSRVEIAAAYLRVRPFADMALDIQAGRIPPVFGAFGRRAYSSDRLLIGYPLAYQYLTSLRPDALPASANDLILMRGRGWQSSFPIGSRYAGPGLPLVSAFRWDTGIQARWTGGTLEAAVSLTQGTLANPRVDDDNGGKQIAGRLAVQPLPAVRLGVSAARGAWIADAVPVEAHTGAQTALGVDAELSAGRWLVRGETVWSRWDVPFVHVPPEGNGVSALAGWLEGRYRISPRISLAARVDRLGFSRLTVNETQREWDADVSRVEAGIGYSLQRNVIWRTVVQYNTRDGGRVRRRTFVSSQLGWWF